MCGICGLISAQPRALGGQLAAMTQALRHRGPDGHGYASLSAGQPLDQPPRDAPDERAGQIFLGHRRLSIIDLAGTAQPLRNEDGTVWVTFNGEIYNHQALRQDLEAKGHRLREQGDTEILVHLWEEYGEQMLEPLVGMFAFAIYDTRDQTLFLARDRYGQKPLYYWQRPGLLAFASELQALWTLPDFPAEQVDPVAAAQYFRYGYVPSPRTIYQGVCSLPPGHHATLRAGQLSLREYWRPRVGGTADTGALQAALDTSVRQRMQADVPLGAFLSGGIDSALIVAAMARQTERPVETFTITTGEPWCDESVPARQTADHLGTRHHQFQVEPDLVEVAEMLATHYGQPFADYSCVPTYYVSRETRGHVTVALSGDGGDELFAGYQRYASLRWYGLAGRLPRPLRRSLASFLPGRMADFLLCAGGLADKGENWTAFFHGDWRRRLFGPALDDVQESAVSRARALYEQSSAGSAVERWLEADQRMYLCDDILVKVDVASMAVSLECRAPLLDHRFAELANSLPLAAKLAGGRLKVALRDLARQRVPAEILELPKRGFTLPMAQWLRGSLREYAHGLLFEHGLESWTPYLREPAVRAMWQAHQAGRQDHSMRLWIVLSWVLWHRALFRR